MSAKSRYFVIFVTGISAAILVFVYLAIRDGREFVSARAGIEEVPLDGGIEYLLTVSDSGELGDIERDLMATELRDLSGEFQDAVELFHEYD